MINNLLNNIYVATFEFFIFILNSNEKKYYLKISN